MIKQMTFAQRCKIAQECLPVAPYRDHLTALHNEMLGFIRDCSDGHHKTWMDGFNCARLDKHSISQSIREAAINWPQYLGDVECAIMATFCYESEGADCIFGLHMSGTPWAEEDANQSRTFMLFVAEALE